MQTLNNKLPRIPQKNKVLPAKGPPHSKNDDFGIPAAWGIF